MISTRRRSDGAAGNHRASEGLWKPTLISMSEEEIFSRAANGDHRASGASDANPETKWILGNLLRGRKRRQPSLRHAGNWQQCLADGEDIPGRTMFIQIFKTGWRIPPGTSIPGYVTFDRDPPTHVTGEGGTPSSGNSYVEFQIKSAAEAEFSESLATPT